jgi:hypothetical protein
MVYAICEGRQERPRSNNWNESAGTVAVDWGLKVDGERILGFYGFIMEYQGLLWVWTHTYSPNGHEFFPILDLTTEVKSLALIKIGIPG